MTGEIFLQRNIVLFPKLAPRDIPAQRGNLFPEIVKRRKQPGARQVMQIGKFVENQVGRPNNF